MEAESAAITEARALRTEFIKKVNNDLDKVRTCKDYKKKVDIVVEIFENILENSRKFTFPKNFHITNFIKHLELSNESKLVEMYFRDFGSKYYNLNGEDNDKYKIVDENFNVADLQYLLSEIQDRILKVKPLNDYTVQTLQIVLRDAFKQVGCASYVVETFVFENEFKKSSQNWNIFLELTGFEFVCKLCRKSQQEENNDDVSQEPPIDNVDNEQETREYLVEEIPLEQKEQVEEVPQGQEEQEQPVERVEEIPQEHEQLVESVENTERKEEQQNQEKHLEPERQESSKGLFESFTNLLFFH